MLTAGYVAVPAEDNNRPVNSLDCFARGAWLGFKIAGIIVAILCINGHLVGPLHTNPHQLCYPSSLKIMVK
jgi:CNT family concentrative nucleoside transporter